jgi:hypothetical protein
MLLGDSDIVSAFVALFILSTFSGQIFPLSDYPCKIVKNMGS